MAGTGLGLDLSQVVLTSQYFEKVGVRKGWFVLEGLPVDQQTLLPLLDLGPPPQLHS